MIKKFSIVSVENKLKSRGKRKVVMVGGSFDILHIGHLHFLQNAKKLGDILIVALNSDSHIRSYKKRGKPIIKDYQRAEMLKGFSCVDYVFLTNKGLYDPYIYKKLEPDILGLGKEKNRKSERLRNFERLHKMFPKLHLKFVNKNAKQISSSIIEQEIISTYKK